MTEVFVVWVQLIACLGFGMLGLRVIGHTRENNHDLRNLYAFTLGMGFLGWSLFFIGVTGLLNHIVIGCFLGCGVAAAAFCWNDFRFSVIRPEGLLGMLAITLICFVFLLDFFESRTPPTDADSLAYHFALPKLFLEKGKIEFVPRALDGAITMLIQMTYLPSLVLGGELGLMLWMFVLGVAAVYAVFVLASQHLGRDWSLIIALIFATTPAFIYGAGSGKVEAKIVIFVIAAILALSSVNKKCPTSHICLVGIFAGFFAGAKYFGLCFVAICGLAVALKSLKIRSTLIFSVAAMTAGFQWYLWNFIHIGDPVFPMMYEWLGRENLSLWTNEHQTYIRSTYLPAFKQGHSELKWLLLFPFKATLMGDHAISSGRTGLGPAILLFLPFAILGALGVRDRLLKGPLFIYLIIVLFYYVSWFFSGAALSVRFLLPVYPVLLVIIFAAGTRSLNNPIRFAAAMGAIIFTIVTQLFGQALYSLKSIKYVMGDENRLEFLVKSSIGLKPIFWVNRNLGKDVKVLSPLRHNLYYFDVPYFYAHSVQQAQINLLPSSNNFAVFIRQLRDLNITHILVSKGKKGNISKLEMYSSQAVLAGCFKEKAQFPVEIVKSRTLPNFGRSKSVLFLYRFLDKACFY